MSWRETLLRKWAGGKRHAPQEWRRLTSPLQMRAEIQNLDLEAARKSFMKSDAPARAIILGSTVSPASMGVSMVLVILDAPGAISLAIFCTLPGIVPQVPKAKDRPPKPTSWLLSRFAWRKVTHLRMSTNKSCNGWITQELIWCSRYGSARANHQPR